MGDSLDPGGGDVGDVAHSPVEKVTNFLRSVFPPNQYIHYMVCIFTRRVVPVVLEDSEEHQAALDAALADKAAIELVRKFIGDASCRFGSPWTTFLNQICGPQVFNIIFPSCLVHCWWSELGHERMTALEAKLGRRKKL